MADFILAILWLIGGIVWLSPGENGWAKENSDSHTGMCYVLAVATTVSCAIQGREYAIMYHLTCLCQHLSFMNGHTL